MVNCPVVGSENTATAVAAVGDLTHVDNFILYGFRSFLENLY